MIKKLPQEKDRHFPDLLFYVISAVSVVSICLFINSYANSINLTDALGKSNDSLSVERNRFAELNNLYESQGELVIENSGKRKFTITDFYVTYYDVENKDFKTIRGIIDNTIESGGRCKPKYDVGAQSVWDGSVLFYFLSVKGGDFLGNSRNVYFSGKWDKSKKEIRINLDQGVGNSSYIRVRGVQ